MELIFTDKSQTQVEAIFSEGTGTPPDMESTADHITSGVSWPIGISPYPPIGQVPVTTLSLDLFNIYSNEIWSDSLQSFSENNIILEMWKQSVL